MRLFSRVLLAGLAVVVVAGSRVKVRPAPRRRIQAARLEADALIASDGTCLPLASWQPEGTPHAIVLALHGYGDYRRGFGLAGSWLVARGVALFAYDQRGFGESETRGAWPGAEALLEDLADAVTAAREKHPGPPIVVLGESMGGSVALAALGGGLVSGVDRLIVAAPAVRGGLPLRQLHDLALRLGALALPWLSVELRRGARPWLAPEEAARLADDPLILRELSVGTYEGLIELATLASAHPAVDLPPTLVLHGALDRTIPRAPISHLLARLGTRATSRLYLEGHHLLLHEGIAEQVLGDCLEWLQREPA